MHMSDALLAPTVGLVMWAVSGVALARASSRLQASGDDRLVPLMGMLGAFVFAAQMINFAIPGTGSSGHLGGGVLLAMLLGPHAALVVIASVLTVQALFFADGGLLALGANIFNIGVLPALVAWPLVGRPLAGSSPSPRRLGLATVLAAIVALQLGAAAVVVQTVASGISSLPADLFALMMLPIHAAIGVVEGLATLAIVLFLRRHRPELLAVPTATGSRSMLPTLGLTALLVAGIGSWFASSHPDGLEWSVARAAGAQEPAAPVQGLHAALAHAQQTTAVLPDYALPDNAQPEAADRAEPWPAVSAGTSLAGVVGATATLALVTAVGLVLRWRRRRAAPL